MTYVEVAERIEEFRRRREEQTRDDVHKAAAALDAVSPGWASVVDVGLLNLRCPHNCILGQVFRPRWWQLWADSGFCRGLNALAGRGLGLNFGVFASPDYQDAWVEAIADRLVPTGEER